MGSHYYAVKHYHSRCYDIMSILMMDGIPENSQTYMESSMARCIICQLNTKNRPPRSYYVFIKSHTKKSPTPSLFYKGVGKPVPPLFDINHSHRNMHSTEPYLLYGQALRHPPTIPTIPPGACAL